MLEVGAQTGQLLQRLVAYLLTAVLCHHLAYGHLRLRLVLHGFVLGHFDVRMVKTNFQFDVGNLTTSRFHVLLQFVDFGLFTRYLAHFLTRRGTHHSREPVTGRVQGLVEPGSRSLLLASRRVDGWQCDLVLLHPGMSLPSLIGKTVAEGWVATSGFRL